MSLDRWKTGRKQVWYWIKCERMALYCSALLHWIGSWRVKTAAPSETEGGIMGKSNKEKSEKKMALKWHCCQKNCEGSTRSRRSAVTLNPAADFCHAQTFVWLFNEHSDCRWCWTDNFQTFGVVCCRPRLFSFGVLSASAFENGPARPPKKDSRVPLAASVFQIKVLSVAVLWLECQSIQLVWKQRWDCGGKNGNQLWNMSWWQFWSDKQRGW